jgi:tripartite ATP-independent transporter DctP family solute receptor
MEYMAKRLGELSNGSVKLEIYPSGQLGTETQAIEMLQNGELAMTKTSTAPMEAFIPEMAVFSLPYIFRDKAHLWKVLNGAIGGELLLKGTSRGLRGLCYYDAGSRNFYTRSKPIVTPDDLKGLKIRVMKSPTSIAMVKALGGSPTPISWSELYSALQQGTVDGAENNPPSFYTNKHYEVCKYFTLDGHTRIPDLLLISEKVWKGLSPRIREWVARAAEDSADYERKLWAEQTKEDLRLCKKKGVRIYKVDTSLFAAKVQPMLDGYKGTKVGDLLERIRNVK